MIQVHFQRADAGATGEKLGRVRMPHAPRVGDQVSFGGAPGDNSAATVYRVTGVSFLIPSFAAAISTEQAVVEDVTVFVEPTRS